MQRRYLSIWFRYLLTDRIIIDQPGLVNKPIVFTVSVNQRKVITDINIIAQKNGLNKGMPFADAKALIDDIQAFDYIPDMESKLLRELGEWCIRYSPIVAINEPDGLFLDISGCAHLWGGEESYLKEITNRLYQKGYHVKAAIADYIGTAWAVARFSTALVIATDKSYEALLELPPSALRLEQHISQRMHKLGMYRIKHFISIPRSVLRRRFGENTILCLAQALGQHQETITPIYITPEYSERLPSLEPIRTAKGIEIAIENLLGKLCTRLRVEGKGLRNAILKCYRIDGEIIEVTIGTHKASHHEVHLFKLLELKISTIEPALGIELFIIEATKVEPVSPEQEVLWDEGKELALHQIAELLDRIENKIGPGSLHRYIPAEHYWPERSLKNTNNLTELPLSQWQNDNPRPVQLLSKPEQVFVTAPIPDYPPMLFIYKGKRHQVKKADGPERIEREWWLDQGEHRDYYLLEDENGHRYWIFRSGHYNSESYGKWFLHGFFA